MSALKLSNPGGSRAPFPTHVTPGHHEPTPALIGWSTYPSAEAAEKAARTLVEERIVACAQVSGPLKSFYRWDGKTTESTEWRLTLKFTVEYIDLVPKRVKETHAYTTPQWVAVRADQISPEYLAWMNGY